MLKTELLGNQIKYIYGDDVIYGYYNTLTSSDRKELCRNAQHSYKKLYRLLVWSYSTLMNTWVMQTDNENNE